MSWLGVLLETAAWLLLVPAALGTIYVLALTLAAMIPRQAVQCPGTSELRRFQILVPAHDEEADLPALLQTLAAQSYPADRIIVRVVADNCTDATARVAREAGARVEERSNGALIGKGHALNWLYERTRPEFGPNDAVLVVDADCVVSPDLLRAVEARLAAGAQAVQARYVVADPGSGAAASLRSLAFALFNHVRSAGRSALGLSAGLQGSGMAFAPAVLERHPWSGALAEDVELHLDLVGEGTMVAYAGECCVTGQIPRSLAEAQSQGRRWEAGRLQLASKAVALVFAGMARVSPARIEAGVSALVPPLSVLVLLALAALAAFALAGEAVGMRLAGLCLVGLVVHVFAGMLVMKAPPRLYWAMLMAPILLGWKLGLMAMLFVSGAPREWMRTKREPN